LKSDREFRAQLVDRRKRLGLTQSAVAKNIGVSRVTIARFETEPHYSSSLYVLQRYAAAVGAQIVIRDLEDANV